MIVTMTLSQYTIDSVEYIQNASNNKYNKARIVARALELYLEFVRLHVLGSEIIIENYDGSRERLILLN